MPSSLDILIGYDVGSSVMLEATPGAPTSIEKESEAHPIARNRAADPREWLFEIRAYILSQNARS